jgi:very-short-patch-repair endonuclease
MKEPVSIPRNPSEAFKKLNPQLYHGHVSKMPRSFEALQKEGSPLEDLFVSLWLRLDDGNHYPFSREFEFSGHRRFKFDFAWPSRRVAVETDGGIFQKGRHNRAAGFARDCEKTNLAVLEGWAVFRLCTGQVTEPRVWRIFEFIKAR